MNAIQISKYQYIERVRMNGIARQGKDKSSIKGTIKNAGICTATLLIETKYVFTDEKALGNVQVFTTLPF